MAGVDAEANAHQGLYEQVGIFRSPGLDDQIETALARRLGAVQELYVQAHLRIRGEKSRDSGAENGAREGNRSSHA